MSFLVIQQGTIQRLGVGLFNKVFLRNTKILQSTMDVSLSLITDAIQQGTAQSQATL